MKAITTNKIHLIDIAILIIAGLLMLLIVNPIGNFPLNDDFVYSRPVLSLITHGSYKIVNGYTAILIAQVFWGFLFCLPFGFSFTALRISVIVLGFAGIIIFYLLTSRYTGNRKLSLICAFLLLANPIFFSLSNTFMTDVPFLSFSLFAIYFFSKAIDQPELKYVLPAIIFSVIAALIRQVGVVVPLAYALTQLLKNKPSLSHWAKYFIPFGIATLLMGAVLIWLKHAGMGTNGDSIMPLFHNPAMFAFRIFEHSNYFLYYAGISLFPVLLFSGYNSFKSLSTDKKIKVGLLVLFFIPSFLYGWDKFPMKGVGNILEGYSVGPNTLRDGYILHLHNLGTLPPYAQHLLSALGLIGAVLLLVNIASLLLLMQPEENATPTKLYFQRIFLLIFIAGYTFLICIPDSFFDRYFLPLLSIMLLLIVTLLPKNWAIKKISFFFSLLYILLMVSFSSLATHDYLQWNRTRWKASEYVTKQLNIPPYRVDGGYEYNGWVFGDYFNKDKDQKFWYAKYNDWVISYGEIPNFNIVRKYVYTNYIPYEQRNIYILRHSVQNTPPVDSSKQHLITLEKEVRANPTPDGYFTLGVNYLTDKRYNDCITVNEKLLALSSDYILAYHSIATAYVKLSRWNDVIDMEERALSYDSSFTYAKLTLKQAQLMLKAKPGSLAANEYLLQAGEYFKEHKYEDCIEACKKCLALDSSSYVVWNNLGIAYSCLKQYSEAEKAFEQALKLKPDYPEAIANLKTTLQAEGKK